MYCPSCGAYNSGGIDANVKTDLKCSQCSLRLTIEVVKPLTVETLINDIKCNSRIQAIKKLRTDTGLGLREAKMVVDVLADAWAGECGSYTTRTRF